ncbi:putative O-antigen polymerase [Crenothrix polyspora]|uniref:Putative O-antigen polymerase n=2 Tax=Crenothrix polyspora TaxID=360316 RepID=A0A1R4HBP5_9GAMM|nr:putative O-antigen polymerase [Crenothrix polyspora]
MKRQLDSLVNLFLVSAVLGSGCGYSHMYLFHICLVLLIGTSVILYLCGVQQLFIKPKILSSYFFLVMICWYTLGLMWSIEPSYTLQYLVYIILGVAIVYVIVGRVVSEESYQSIYDALKWVFLAEVVIAILEVFTPFRLPTSPFSEYASLFDRKATDFELFEADTVAYFKNMPTAFHGNPNNLAVVMATILPFFLFYPRLLVKILGTSLVLMIIIMAGSRGAFIGAVFGIVLYWALTDFRRILVLAVFGILASFLLVASIDKLKRSDNMRVVEFAYTADVLMDYASNDSKKDDNSVSIRQGLIKNGLDALYASGGLGVGGGGNQAVQESKGGNGAEGEISAMHNFWIEILVESGVGFFLCFVAWYLTMCFKLFFIYITTTSDFFKYQAGALLVSFAIFSVACISASSVIYHLPMWIMFGMALALINLWYNPYPMAWFVENESLPHKNTMEIT